MAAPVPHLVTPAPTPSATTHWRCTKCDYSSLISSDLQACPECSCLREDQLSPRYLPDHDLQRVNELQNRFDSLTHQAISIRDQLRHPSDRDQYQQLEETKQTLTGELSRVFGALRPYLQTDGPTPNPSSSASSFRSVHTSYSPSVSDELEPGEIIVEGDEEESRSSSPSLSLPGIMKRRQYSLVKGMSYQQSFQRFQQHWYRFFRGQINCHVLLEDTEQHVALIQKDPSISPAALGNIGLVCASAASLLYSFHRFDDAHRMLDLGSELVDRSRSDDIILEVARIHLCLVRSCTLRRQLRVSFQDRPLEQKEMLTQAMMNLKEAASRYQGISIRYYEPFTAAELLEALNGLMLFCKELLSRSAEALPGTSHSVAPTLKPQNVNLPLVQNPWSELQHEFQYFNSDSNYASCAFIKHTIDLYQHSEIDHMTWVFPILRMVTHLRNMKQWDGMKEWLDRIPTKIYHQLPILYQQPLCRELLALFQWQREHLKETFDLVDRIDLLYSLITKFDPSMLAPIDYGTLVDLKRQISELHQARILKLVKPYLTDLEWSFAFQTCRLWYRTACSSFSARR